jgi:hypothetical protein
MSASSSYDFLSDLLHDSERGAEQRQFDRREVRVSAELIPLLPRGLKYDQAIAAASRNVSVGGIALEVGDLPLFPRWAVRLELGARSAILEVDIRHVDRESDGKLVLSCKFVRRLDPPARWPVQ